MTVATARSEDGTEVVIRVRGQFDFGLHRDFRDAYREVTGVARFVVNLGETEYMDSSALGMLLLLREHAEARGAEVVLTGVHGELDRVLRIANFHQLFAIRR